MYTQTDDDSSPSVADNRNVLPFLTAPIVVADMPSKVAQRMDVLKPPVTSTNILSAVDVVGFA